MRDSPRIGASSTSIPGSVPLRLRQPGAAPVPSRTSDSSPARSERPPDASGTYTLPFPDCNSYCRRAPQFLPDPTYSHNTSPAWLGTSGYNDRSRSSMFRRRIPTCASLAPEQPTSRRPGQSGVHPNLGRKPRLCAARGLVVSHSRYLPPLPLFSYYMRYDIATCCREIVTRRNLQRSCTNQTRGRGWKTHRAGEGDTGAAGANIEYRTVTRAMPSGSVTAPVSSCLLSGIGISIKPGAPRDSPAGRHWFSNRRGSATAFSARHSIR